MLSVSPNFEAVQKRLFHQRSFKYPFALFVNITSEKIHEINSKIKLKPLKKKIPVNYF